MTTLQATTFHIDLKPAKANGLAELGLPAGDATEVKKGRLSEAMQMLAGGERIGRRYQNLRATLLKASEGGQPGVKLVLACEIFGDDNTALGAPAPISAQLLAGDTVLAELTLGAPFLPYGACWYDNRFAADLPLAAFAAADAVRVSVPADAVRLI